MLIERTVERKKFQDKRICSVTRAVIDIFSPIDIDAEVRRAAFGLEPAAHDFLVGKIHLLRRHRYRALVCHASTGALSSEQNIPCHPRNVTHLLEVLVEAASVLNQEFPTAAVINLLSKTVERLEHIGNETLPPVTVCRSTNATNLIVPTLQTPIASTETA